MLLDQDQFNPENYLIFLVDDCRHNLTLTCKILESVKYQVIIACDGREAINRLEDIKPHLMILDFMMPYIDGIELCELIKNKEKYYQIPIIFLTANEDEAVIVKAFESGASDYINKPYKPLELLARVKIHLQLREARKNLEIALKEKENLIEKLSKQANTDSLTEMLNRGYIFSLGDEEFKKCQQGQTTFCLLILDIDHFKMINDQYGHPTGDLVLQTISKTLKQSVRGNDFVGRIGGEEFMIILPNTSAVKGYKVAERIRKNIADTPLLLASQHKINITTSIGLAVYEDNYKNFSDIVSKADEALYHAKHQGRNRVISIFPNDKPAHQA